MQGITKISLFVVATCLLQGCATIFSGTTQSISIKAVDTATNSVLDGCVCTVTDGSGGMQTTNGNPGVVHVSKSTGGALQVNCHKKGYKQLNTSVGDSFNGTTLVNVLFWPGFIVDAASGAYKKYPSHYLVSMEKM